MTTLSTRKALRDFARNRSPEVNLICWRLRHALRQSERCDSPALREMIQLDTAALAACR